MPGSAHWPMPLIVCHVAASGLRLSGEQECMRIGPDTCRRRTPTWALIKALVCSVLEPWDPTVGGPDPIRGGPDPNPGVRSIHVGGPGPNLEVRTVYPGFRYFPMEVRTHC
jgi:hypothetical protein